MKRLLAASLCCLCFCLVSPARAQFEPSTPSTTSPVPKKTERIEKAKKTRKTDKGAKAEKAGTVGSAGAAAAADAAGAAGTTAMPSGGGAFDRLGTREPLSPSTSTGGTSAAGTVVGGVQPMVQRWKIGLQFRAKGSSCGNILGTMPVPVDWPEQTVKVIEEKLTPQVTELKYRELEGDVKQMVITIPTLQTGETASAIVVFEVTRTPIFPPEDTSKFVIPKNISKELRRYLAASPLIEISDPRIKAKAKEVAQDKEGAWEKVEAIYDWVRANVKYENSSLKGALAAMRDGKGDCEELTSLFVAFCRVNGVPARCVWIPNHCYPEFYLEDEEGNGHWFPCQAAGSRDFGGMVEYRPILQKGDNIRVPEQKEPLRYAALQRGKAIRGGGQPDYDFIMEVMGEK